MEMQNYIGNIALAAKQLDHLKVWSIVYFYIS